MLFFTFCDIDIMNKALKLSYDELWNLNENLEKRIKILEEKVLRLKNVEETTRESEQRFKQLADSSFEGVLIHENGYIIDSNLQMATMLGYNETDLNGRNFLDFIVMEYRKEAIQSIRSDSQMAYNTVLRKKNGEYIEIEVLSRPFNYKGRNMKVAALRDLSYRKLFEKTIEESEIKFRQLAENSFDAIVLINGPLVLYWNQAFEKIFGITGIQVHKNPEFFLDMAYNEDKPDLLEKLKSDFYIQDRKFDAKYRIVRPDNSIVWIWNRSFPIFNRQGELLRQVMMISDITDQKNLEYDTTKNRAQIEALLDNIPYFAWLKDDKGRYVMANQPFSDHYKITRDELVGKTDFDILHPENAKKSLNTDQEVISAKNRKLYQEVEEENGELKWSETFKTPVLNEQNEVIGIAGIARDITNRKKAELALKFSEEKFKELVTLLPEMVFETDLEGNFTFLNLKAFETLEYTSDDVGKAITLFNILAPDDSLRAKENFARLLKGEDIKSQEYIAISMTGRKFPVLIYANTMHGGNKATGYRGVMIDITDRRIAEDREKNYNRNLVFLSNSALKFLSFSNDDDIFIFIGKKLSDLTRNAIIVVSSYNELDNTLSVRFISGINRYLNNILQILGKTPEDIRIKVTGRFKKKLLAQEHSMYPVNGGLYNTTLGQIPQSECMQLEKLLKLSNYYTMGLLKGGNLYGVVLMVTKSNQVIRDEKIIETFLFQASISLHRKQLENELIRAKDKAEESDRLKSAFLANMSHEIRTPMNGILGMTQLLAIPDISSDQRKEYLELINKNSETLLNLIDDIVDVSKIEAGQMKIIRKPFRLNPLFDQLNMLFSSSSVYKSKKDLKLLTSKSLPDSTTIFTDPDRLRQIFINLIGNSLKFTESGHIEFGYTLESEKLLFFVKDTGIGISTEKQEVIFDRFTQADDSLTRKFGGSGLGLAISRGLIELLGGNIWVNSTLQHGSTFYFTIPYIPAEESEEQDKMWMESPSDFNWSGRTFLIVEDDKVSFKFLEGIFRKTAATILHADNGIKAIEFCKSNPEIDIVLMDIQLPEMSGLDATRIIKAIRKTLPIIAQTANAMSDDKEKCLEVGCVDYVSKPINVNLLFHKIEKHLIPVNQ
jgi:PAS domain S-box-containing protein